MVYSKIPKQQARDDKYANRFVGSFSESNKTWRKIAFFIVLSGMRKLTIVPMKRFLLFLLLISILLDVVHAISRTIHWDRQILSPPIHALPLTTRFKFRQRFSAAVMFYCHFNAYNSTDSKLSCVSTSITKTDVILTTAKVF